MSAVDPVGAAPETKRPAFLRLLAGCIAAPVFWLGQVMLSYTISAATCYPGDVPRQSGPGSLSVLLLVFDAVALAASVAGGALALSTWLRGASGRDRFLALWGLLSSLWFFFAILFNTIASVMAPVCGE